MIQRIILQDFQAHNHTVLELDPGVNVLTGPNNTGKSAIVEALRCLATNPPPKHVIRHGAKLARVEVELENGVRVAWNRKKTTAWYELFKPGDEEPEYFRKLGRGMVPDEIRDALRLDEVELENNTQVDVHIGDQKRPIFLLDSDGADARLAEFFAASSEGAHLLAMQSALKSRTREARMRHRVLGEGMERCEQGLERLQTLPRITLHGLHARAAAKAAGEGEAALTRLQQTRDRQNDLQIRQRRAGKRAQALEALASPPTPADVHLLKERLNSMQRLEQRRVTAHRVQHALTALTPPPEPESTINHKQLIHSLNHLERKQYFESQKATILTTLQGVPQPLDVQPLAELLKEMRGLEQRMESARRIVAAREDRLRNHGEALQQRLREVGHCPLCGNALNQDAFLGGAARKKGDGNG